MKSQTNIRSLFRLNISIAIIALQTLGVAFAVDIAPMTWTPRPEWINVMTDPRVSPHAVGDGVADDTAAIQSAFNLMNYNPYTRGTIYFPVGTYKITNTVEIDVTNYSLVGCGLNTIIKWAGPNGLAMIWPNGGGNVRYEGFVWDGNNSAGCAFLEYSSQGSYMTGIRHENEAFRNFTAIGTYLPADYLYPGGYPGTAIISGLENQANPGLTNPVGEVTIHNCLFANCTVGVYNPVDIFNNFMWTIDGCEFDNNGTGVNGGSGGADMIVINTHFQGSTVDDIVQVGGFRGQRITSSGSAQFYNGYTGGTDIQDCLVDGWTNPSCAMELYGAGLATVADCTFTHPPAGAAPPILDIGNSGSTELMLSNNNSPAFPSGPGLQPDVSLLSAIAGTPTIDWIPAGSMSGNLTSATQTFLKSTYPPDAINIIDVTAAPYNVNPNDLSTDSTAGIQAAINDAAAANNGTCVYIPFGKYTITSTLNVTGGNYIIEGEGYFTDLLWYGGSNATEMAVTNPQNITIRHIHLSSLANLPAYGSPYYNPAYATSDPSTVVGLKETATGASSVVYDGIYYDDFGWGNPEAGGGGQTDKGLCLSGLPAGSVVYIPELESPLTVIDCGPAQIFSLRAYMGAVNVSGATQPKTGYMGLMVAEGGVGAGRPLVPTNPYIYNITVSDDQNLLVGPYYSEQEFNNVDLEGGSGTTPGRVAIQGIGESPSPVSVSININNYTGRLFYNQQYFFGGYVDPTWAIAPVQVTQTGSNHVDMVLANDSYYGTEPTFTLDTGANLVSALSQYGVNGTPPTLMADNPSPLTPAALASIAQGFDDCRQLGAVNLAAEYGQVNPSGLVAYWKLDEPASPAVDSSMSLVAGTWQNGPTFTTDHPGLIPYADAGSMMFNGSNQYIDMGTPPAGLPSGSAARTICGWAKSPSGGQAGPYGYGMFASYGNPGNGEGMWLGANGTALAVGSWGFDLPFVPNFWDGNWHFICLTYDGTTASLYADGVLKEAVNESATPWNLVSNVCYIGCYLNKSCYWNGSVDDVRIYNRALSQDEITALAGTPAPEGTLITGVTATSTSPNLEGNPGLTTSNNSLVAGLSGVLGGSDSLGDCGFNPDDASDFGNFVTTMPGANVTYDLGSVCNVTNLLIWNFSQPGFANAGANSVTISSSTDNVTFTTVGTYTFNEAAEAPYGSPRPLPGNNPPHPLGAGGANELAQVLPVSIPSARYIKLVINSNWGYAGAVGLNEVNFLGFTGPTVYDLATDFNSTSDLTSNIWCYGTYSSFSNPATFSIPASIAYSNILSGLGLWNFPPPPPAAQTDPNVEKNLSASDIFGAGIDWRPGKVSFGPWQGPSVARFTAPAAGIYNISAAFQTDQIRGTETDDGTTGYVYIGGTNEFTQELTDPGAAQFGNVASFSANNISLRAGETVDFVVGGGAFTTQVDATVTKIDP